MQHPKIKTDSLLFFFSIIFILFFFTRDNQDFPVGSLRLPEGFKIDIYASGIKDARSLAAGAGGTVFVGTRHAGKVYALRDEDRDNRAEKVYTIAQGLNMPNGVAFRGGDLYVAEVSRVVKFENIENNLEKPPAPVVINRDLPDHRSHGWKYIAFGPDGKLYVPVGAPCNVCNPRDRRFATIMRMNADGGNLEIFAEGIRNTVGFDWHPVTGELWFTDNGRDAMGDNIPPDELNVAPRKGIHFGFPFCHGINIPDPEFGRNRKCAEFTPPMINLGPHVAALGMKFYRGSMFPEEYRRDVFIAEHGSFDRSEPIGYRITRIRMENRKPVAYEIFADGWLVGSKAWGRPVDVLVMHDGALLVSDDKAGAIYRISYGN